MRQVKNMPGFERPREKLAARGAESLSDMELLAVLIGRGIKGKNVFHIARAILRMLDTDKGKVSLKALLSIEGVGLAKACRIMASLEFARRRMLREGVVIRKPEDILPIISYIADKKQEHFVCVSLNGANEVIENRVVTVGLLDKNQVHPREVFVDAIVDRAAAVILAHNHPSGVLNPSPDDIAATRQLVDAGKILGIPVLDHLIIAKKGYLSLKQRGII